MNHQFQYRASLSCIALLALAGAAHADLIVGEAQFSLGDVSPSPITAVSGDLLETSVASVTGERAAANPRDGVTGTSVEQSDFASGIVWGQAQTIYELDLDSAPEGYDVGEIRVFSGWRDSRAGQSYVLDYSLVGDAAWINLGTVSELVTNGSLLTRTYDDAGGLVASGVDAIRITQVDNGNAGTGTVIREIDVISDVSSSGPSAPEISEISYDQVASTVTLTWSSQPNVIYNVQSSLDLIDWDSDLGDSITTLDDEIPGDGNNFTVTFALNGELAGLPRLFFRVES